MSDFSAQLAAAKAAPRPFKEVQVCLDVELAAKREQLLGALSAAEAKDAEDQRLAGPSDVNAGPIREALDELKDAAESAMVTLRFTRVPGDVWAELTSKHPVRVEVPIDRHYGYNYDAVCLAAAAYRDEKGTVYAHRVVDDELFELEPAQWVTLFEVLSGHEVQSVRDAIWSLNEFEPSQRLNQLVKGFGAATRSDTK